MAVISHTCERIRALASVALDGELSEIEQAMLAAHLLRCEPCDAYARQAAAFTQVLRDAPLELLPFPVAIHRRRSVHGATRVAAVAAVAAVAVGLGSSLLSGYSDGTRLQGSTALPVAPVSKAQLIDDRLNWTAGLPRVKPSELAIAIGQRNVSLNG